MAVRHSEAAYENWMTGEVPYYRDRQSYRIRCPEFFADLADGSLSYHDQTQYGIVQETQWVDTPPLVEP